MIPVNEPLISTKAQQYVLDCIKTGWVSSAGKYIELFEQSFAKYLGVKYAVTTTNGTSALHLALTALGIGHGDEVIVPDLTIISCAFTPIYLGAKPVFVDVDPVTGTIDPTKIEEKITKKTKAIMVVHLYGNVADMNTIKKIAKKYKLYIIEDTAEAIGSEYKGKKAGTFSDIGCFSFYANKLVTAGEGGMVVTNNKILFKRLKSLKNLAHSPERRFVHTDLGYNYLMTNMQAALGLAQLENIQSNIDRKKWLFKHYRSGLLHNSYLQLPVPAKGVTYVCWMYNILLKRNAPFSKKTFRQKLKENGIDTREYFFPLHKQPILKKLAIVSGKEKYPVTAYLFQQGLYLPSGLAITKSQIDTVVGTINNILHHGT